MAPSFLQFLDCVWQIFKEMPEPFEFNERLLMYLADNAFGGRFGTFLKGVDREVLFEVPIEPVKNPPIILYTIHINVGCLSYF